MTDGPRVELRGVRAADLETLYEHQRDDEACRVARFESRPHDAFMDHWGRILADDGVFSRAVLVDGRLAGHVVAFERSAIRQVGYWIGREFWGRGVASAALALALPEIDGRPLYAFVSPANGASRRVLEKCGFRISHEPLTDPAGPGDPEDDLLFRLEA